MANGILEGFDPKCPFAEYTKSLLDRLSYLDIFILYTADRAMIFERKRFLQLLLPISLFFLDPNDKEKMCSSICSRYAIVIPIPIIR